MGSLFLSRQENKIQSHGDDDHHEWMMIMEDDAKHHKNHDDDDDEKFHMPSSSEESSIVSNGSSNSYSSDHVVEDDDACSSSSSSSSSSTIINGSLYDLSELIAHLPIKKGLSKYYNGKSQSFTSLSRVTSLQDLAKTPRNTTRTRSMKPCKSYGANLDHTTHKSANFTLPKSTISKKVSRTSSSSFSNRRSSRFLSRLPPPIPVKSSVFN